MTGGWSASTSGYYDGHDRAARVTRVHLIPPPGTFPRRGGPSAACGQPWWDVQNAPRTAVPLDGPLPDGLTWCPKCLGIAAEVLGVADAVGRLVVAKASAVNDR